MCFLHLGHLIQSYLYVFTFFIYIRDLCIVRANFFTIARLLGGILSRLFSFPIHYWFFLCRILHRASTLRSTAETSRSCSAALWTTSCVGDSAAVFYSSSALPFSSSSSSDFRYILPMVNVILAHYRKKKKFCKKKKVLIFFLIRGSTLK